MLTSVEMLFEAEALVEQAVSEECDVYEATKRASLHAAELEWVGDEASAFRAMVLGIWYLHPAASMEIKDASIEEVRRTDSGRPAS